MDGIDKVTAAVIITSILTIGGCTGGVEIATVNAKRAMVERGANPMDARCAFVMSGSSDPICVAHASKR